MIVIIIQLRYFWFSSSILKLWKWQLVCVLRAWRSWMKGARAFEWMAAFMTCDDSAKITKCFWHVCIKLLHVFMWSHEWVAFKMACVACPSMHCVAGTKSMILRIRIKCIQPNGNAFQTEIKWNTTDGYAYEMHSKQHQRKVDSRNDFDSISAVSILQLFAFTIAIAISFASKQNRFHIL